MGPGPEAKASGHLTFMRVLEEMAGCRWGTYVAALPADARELVLHPPLPLEWIPYRHFPVYLRTALEQLFGGDLARVVDLGRLCTLADLRGIYRIFVRLATPEFVIERAPSVFAAYLRNAGAVRLGRRGPRDVQVCYSGVPFPSPAYWAYQQGSVQGAVQAPGTRRVDVAAVDGGGASSRCTFRVAW